MAPSGSFIDRIAAVAFVLGLAAVTLGYGFLAGSRGLFPAEQLHQLEEVAEAFYKAYLQPASRASAGLALPPRDGRAGAIVHDRARMAAGVTFLTLYTGEGFESRIIDADGKILHRWQAKFSDVFPEPDHLMWKAPDPFIVWHGAWLFDDGGILFNFQDKSFPYGGGLVRLDKDSHVVWSLPLNTHHDVMVEPDGTIVVPAMHYRPAGVPEFPNMRPWYYEDTILRVSADGKVLTETSVLKALASYPGFLSLNYKEDLEIVAEDPTHVNGAEPLPADWADRFPMFAPGDLLVSLRNMNAIAVIDPATERVKWALAGLFAKQHDADYLSNGHLMVFDNAGGDPACGGTRVLEIDPASQAVVWSYDGCNGPPFATELRGSQQMLPNGNVLITESLGGRVLEVTREDRQVVWEYVNAIEVDGRHRVGLITHAERFPRDQLIFLPAVNPQ